MSVVFDLKGGTRTGGGALSQFVPKGTPSEVPTFTPPAGYLFSGWSSTPDLINSDIIISAQYELVSGTTYNVTFDLGNGTRSGGGALSQTVPEGSSALAPTVAPPAGYTFTGWNRAFSHVTSNLTVIAQYEVSNEATYTVSFNLGSGTRSGGGALSQTVTEGGAAIAPTVTPPTGYLFSGWSGSFTNVTSNLSITAQYTESNTGSGTTITNGTGRYVRISIPTEGSTKMKLYLEEVEIYVNGSNIAPSGTATQSSDLTSSYSADNAVDQGAGAFTSSATQWNENPWWEVDLGSTVDIEKIVITNITGSNAALLSDFTVTIYDANRNPVHEATNLPNTSVTTLTAATEVSYNVIFDLGIGTRSGGGSLSQTVTSGSAAIAPTVIPPTGYTFNGWSRPFENVTSHLTISALYQQTATGSGTTISNGLGRYIRIAIPTEGTAKMKLYLEEVEVYVAGSNIAPSGTATQSSDLTSSYTADNAVDQGDGAFTNSATQWNQNPWWELDLGATVDIEKIVITNITGTNATLLSDFNVTIYDADRNAVHLAENLPNASVTTLNSESDEIINGVPASWLVANGYALNIAATNSDADGDGHTALQEYLAGTDPNSRSSRFKMRSCKKENNSITLDWESVSGKTYQVWYSPDMSQNSWSIIASGISGAEETTSYELASQSSTALKGFYRIVVN